MGLVQANMDIIINDNDERFGVAAQTPSTCYSIQPFPTLH